ncbi:LacI family DNA-binding transcriptional regulator [Brachybacterium hainanense]|uniref:LacI family DNA-binding transcriptional regulator n=1 Tax=Brachybacterium hainanense TaxID=1541174 RepID=A0ABV6RCL1_9MICO
MPPKKTGNRRPTIADIARLAGVSKTTVSRVLNDSALVNAATREAVEAAMTQAGYTVSWQARTLATGQSDAIALIVTEPLSTLFSDPTFATILHGVYGALAGSALIPVLLQASTAQEQAKVRRLLDQRGVDAVIHLTPYFDDGLLPHLQEMGMPTVLLGRLPGDPYDGRFSVVYSDDEVGGALAAHALLRRGVRHPAALLGPADNPASTDRLAGYRRELGAGLGPDRVLHGDWDERSGAAMTAQLLDDGVEIDGLLCASDRIAAGALETLAARGIAVPEQVAVIGFDGHPFGEATRPPLTTIAQPMQDEGARAVELALALIRGTFPRTVVLPSALVPRASA